MHKLFRHPSLERPCLRAVSTMLLCLGLTGLAVAQSSSEPFHFGKVDLEFLDQIKQLDKKFEDRGLVYREPELNAYVDRVGRSLIKADEPMENVVWRFRVFRDPSVNAFALPNGSIYVHTGLLALLENEAQLAGVLAHEIIHVRNRHSYLSYRSYRKKVLTANIVTAVASAFGGGFQVGLAAQFMLTLSVIGYSRELEKEADIEGARLMAASPYDPKEMRAALESLLPKYEVDLDGDPFYSDHPKTKDRIAYLNEWLSKSAPKRDTESAGLSIEDYLKNAAEATRHDIQLAIDAGMYRTATALGNRLVAAQPDLASNLTALANSYTALGPRSPEPLPEEKTGHGKKEAGKRHSKLTLQEEDRTLAATPAGQELQKANCAEAEKLYRRATELEPNYAPAWRGLGELFEKQKQSQQSIEAYHKYLELQPGAMDRLMIMRRVKAMESTNEHNEKTAE
ncbi:MAG: M48 family metalloprotease [Chloracidobacterium sp.]|nr:M48 family metalloprotease [Chloracidobacterium sp.]